MRESEDGRASFNFRARATKVKRSIRFSDSIMPIVSSGIASEREHDGVEPRGRATAIRGGT